MLSFRLRSANICGHPSAGRYGRDEIRDVLQPQNLCFARHGRRDYPSSGVAAQPVLRRSDAVRAHRWLAGYPRWFTIVPRKWEQSITPARQLTRPPTLLRRRFLRAARRSAATVRALAVHENEPQGLIHSDVHIGNWYRTGTGQMGLCDWQCLSRGHWSRDLPML